jgi:hypothetical protein
LEQIIEPDPAEVKLGLFLLWVLVPFIFMGVGSLINALVGRKMINGALIYLFLAAAVFVFGVWSAISNPANTSGDAEALTGHYSFYFGIPMQRSSAIALENAETGPPARPSPRPNAGFHEPSGDVAAKRIGLLPRSEIYTETRGYRANKDSFRGQIALP